MTTELRISSGDGTIHARLPEGHDRFDMLRKLESPDGRYWRWHGCCVIQTRSDNRFSSNRFFGLSS